MIAVPGGPQDPVNAPRPAAPSGYRYLADGQTLERIPGGPADDKAAARFAGAPPGYQWNADHSALEKIPGGPADKPERMANDSVVKGIHGNLSSLRQLDDALATAQSHPEAFGLGQGNQVVSWAEQTLPQGLGGSPQTSIDARAKVANIGSLKLHERSGAAVTASEFPRLAPFVPGAGDSAETVRTKLGNMRLILQESLRDQYDTYGPANGYKAVPGHASALGLEESGRDPKGSVPVPGKDGGASGDVTPISAPASASGSSARPDGSSGSGGADRRLAAVQRARQMLPPGASDADVLAKAQELVNRTGY